MKRRLVTLAAAGTLTARLRDRRATVQKGVVAMMSLSKGKAAVAVLAAVIFLGTGVVVTSDVARGQNPATGATGADLREKAQARVRAAEKLLASMEERVNAGEQLTPAFVELQAGFMRRLAEARLDATDDSAARLNIAREYLQGCRDVHATLYRRRGQDVTKVQLFQADYFIADAEYLLAKLQGK